MSLLKQNIALRNYILLGRGRGDQVATRAGGGDTEEQGEADVPREHVRSHCHGAHSHPGRRYSCT